MSICIYLYMYICIYLYLYICICICATGFGELVGEVREYVPNMAVHYQVY